MNGAALPPVVRVRPAFLGMFVAYVTAAAGGCATKPSRAAVDHGLDRAVDDTVASYLAKVPVASVSVAIARGDRIVLSKAYGSAVREKGQSATSTTVYRIGSVTKQFTAALVLQQVESGRLSLDDPLRKWLPDYPSEGAQITIRHLLAHVAGVYSYTREPGFMRKAATPTSIEALIASFSTKALDFKPGSRWGYSNSGYVLLGAILEKVTGMSYAALVKTRISDPLRLHSLQYCPNVPDETFAAGYDLKGGDQLVAADPIHMTWPHAAGALCANAVDLANWSIALHRGRVVSAALVRQMVTPVVLADGKTASLMAADGKTASYGFGVELGQFHGHPLIRHDGAIHGFASTLMYYPHDDVTIAVLMNTLTDSTVVGRQIARVVLGSRDAPDTELP
jgi:D-alanyl-D-alanine carboxypeptidase